jgi:transcriptional regulator with XRE-family HTH domain
MTRDQLIQSREYWIAKIQLDLFNQIEKYMGENNLSRTQLAEKLGVTKGYVSQILNGDFDHKISKLVDLALAIGKVPDIQYTDLYNNASEEIITSDTVGPHRPFKAIISGNQLQSLSYPNDTSETTLNSKRQIA